MNILFYIDPESDLLSSNTLCQWAKWLKIINKLLKSNYAEYNYIFVGYESAKSYFEAEGELFLGLSEDDVNDLINQNNIFRSVGSCGVNSEKIKKILSIDFKPDFIISAGDAKYLECLFPNAGIIHIEMSPFYRLLNSGLRFCVTFKDFPKLSDVVHNISDFDGYVLSPKIQSALQLVKSEVVKANRSELLAIKIKKHREYFKNICLIPFAEKYFSPLKIKVFDLIVDFMKKSNPNDLYILADHPLSHEINDFEMLELKRMYKNILLVSGDFGEFSTHNFYELCDVVYTDFSNASLDSLFFDGIRYKSVLAEFPDEIKKYSNFRNALSSHMCELSKDKADKILYFLLRYYSVSDELFFDGFWWHHLISSWNKTVSLAEIENRLG